MQQISALRAAILVLLVLGAGTAGWGLSLSQARPTKGDSVLIHDGFGTGQAYLNQMSSLQRRAYAMGVINGMLVSPMFGASKDKLHWLEQCVENMNDEQVAAIILKHIKDHPERWHYGLHFESWTAMKDACGGT